MYLEILKRMIGAMRDGDSTGYPQDRMYTRLHSSIHYIYTLADAGEDDKLNQRRRFDRLLAPV